MLFALLAPLAHATPSFDPTTTDAVFEGQETYDSDGVAKRWSRVERHVDPARQLFTAGAFNSATAWDDNSTYAPWIGDCFGTSTPPGSTFLLHVGLHADTATGTPVLMMPGAGDNGPRAYSALAQRLDAAGHPVFVLTFAHPHGDVFEQAEVVADAVARIKTVTGAASIDLISHSKGGVAQAIYLSNYAGADWDDPAYAAVGTVYRGDVRRAVFLGAPLGGIDTGYRWPTANLLSTDADTALAPVSWSLWYPYGTANPYVYVDLGAQDFLPEDGDLFPGQRQLLRRQDADLPGSLPWLGSYALQPDWYTTYEGGCGFTSCSDGIDDAIAAGGDVIARLARAGVDPGVEVYLVAGDNPLMPNGAGALLAAYFGSAWADLATSGVDVWASLLADAVGDGLVAVGISDDEVQGLASGDLILGEITGPSDGLVFVESATAADQLDARGARIVETYVANLSHLDLLYASPESGDALVAEAGADPLRERWKAALGARYREADTVGWVERVLADASGGDDTGDGSDGDTGPADTASAEDSAGGDDTGDDAARPAGGDAGCAGCASARGELGVLPMLVLAFGVMARRRVTAADPHPPSTPSARTRR
jgi:hypothetical protein